MRKRMTEIAGRESWIGCHRPTSLKLEEIMAQVGQNLDVGGFACVRGGREAATDLLPGMQGFCMQRAPLGDRVGNFTRWQSVQMGMPAAELMDKETEEQTFAATTIHGAGELYSLDYLQFLVKERQLEDFTVQHLLLFEERDYLTPFIDNLLQRRWDLRHGKSDLMGTLLKLCVNCK